MNKPIQSKTIGEPDEFPVRLNWSVSEIAAIHCQPFNDLLFAAHKCHRANFDPNKIQLSALLNIKTGGCAEDCKYCSQSSRYDTGLKAGKLMDKEHVLKSAEIAKTNGADRFCMGAAWRDIKDRDLDQLLDIIASVKELGLEICATLGMATPEQLKTLKLAGLDYYNHNIDTSPEFYANVITTRTFDDRLKTLQAVRDAGINVCCGGILGLGETTDDRISMLETLATLPEHPQSFPVNTLVAIKGTPMENNKKTDPLELVRFIATARIVMPKTVIRLSAGRSELTGGEQALAYFAGANSIFYGKELLTTPNAEANDDRTLMTKLGLMPGIERKSAVSDPA